MGFRDVLDITVQAGKGGDGGLSFMRLKYIPKGGPDGGHGGKGGSVFLRAVDDVTSIDRLVGRTTFKAPVGRQGEGKNRAGLSGEDVYVDVPVGTIATDLETGEVIGDLLEVGEVVCVAKGGEGGRGNSSFANSVRRTPRFAEYGTPGEKRKLRLELRIIADVGLVGYPNAGKSSLLATLSNSRPLVADYPFTTLSPNLGVVELDHHRFTMADIPGIIEDAHLGKGLGLDFLRHISRTRLLVYVLDLADDPAVVFDALRTELVAYDPLLLERPALIVLNKLDLVDAEALAAAESELAEHGLPLMSISTVSGAGLDELRRTLFALLPARPAPVSTVTQRRTELTPTTVKRDMSGLGWLVSGTEIEAVVNRFDPMNKDAVAYLQHHFRSLGIDKLLKRAGASNGEEVRIGDAVFDYLDTDSTPEDAADDGVGTEDGSAFDDQYAASAWDTQAEAWDDEAEAGEFEAEAGDTPAEAEDDA